MSKLWYTRAFWNLSFDIGVDCAIPASGRAAADLLRDHAGEQVDLLRHDLVFAGAFGLLGVRLIGLIQSARVMGARSLQPRRWLAANVLQEAERERRHAGKATGMRFIC